jgi:hypothetical protein
MGVSFGVIATTLYNYYANAADSRLARGVKNCNYYVDSMRLSALNIAQDEEFLSQLQDGEEAYIISKLDYLCNYSLDISGVTVYTLSDQIYSSSRISNLPTLADLSNDELIYTFIHTDAMDVFSFRKESIFKTFDATGYSEEYGIISYLCKLYTKDEHLLGYMLTDLMPSVLYDFFQSNKNDDMFDDIVSFIGYGEHELFLTSTNIDTASYATSSANRTFTKDWKYMIICSQISGNGKIIYLIPLRSYLVDISGIAALFIALILISSFVAYLFTVRQVNGVSNRLNALLKKMNENS